MTDLNLILPDNLDPDRLAATLAVGLTAETAGTATVRRRYCDSFDWRLHRAGLVLVREARRWRLCRLDDGAVEAEAAAGSGPWPRFADGFPTDGGLRKRLAKLLKLRAVIHLVTVAGERRTWRVLNDDGKTVLRIDVTDLLAEKPAGERGLHLATLRPVRGYDGAVARARAAAATLELAPLDRPIPDAVLATVGVEPESYSSRFRADLTAAPDALAAAVLVSRTLLGAMRRNETGVRTDLDTEFLHDFRVAVRRQRSAITIFKKVFAAEPVAEFKRGFAVLGQLTGPLRDLDVSLLDEDRYRGLVPAALRPGLDGLFDHLRERRADAVVQVRRGLGSAAYRELTGTWEAFLDDPRPGPAAGQSPLALACDRLRQRYRRVVRLGGAIDDTTADSALHRLRIECKKLRYLLEFFASLFPAEDVAALVDQLKALQDNLGEFNDLCVQQDMLQSALSDLPARRKSALAEAAALGGLVAVLNARQQVVRGEFHACFAAFSRPTIDRRFARLIGSEENPA